MKDQQNELLNYLNSLKEEDGGIRFSATAPANFLSTSFGVMVYYLLGEKDRLDVSLLRRFWGINENTSTVNIVDPSFNVDDLIGIHRSDYVTNQITYFSLIALDAIGIQFESISMAEPYVNDTGYLEQWFNSLDLSRFWYESNNIMFMMYYFFYIMKYGNKETSSQAKISITHLIKLLNKTQDSNTGYWGTNLNNNNLLDGCFGASHIYLFYDYLGEEIPYVNEIIDNTLSLHQKNGLLGSKYGGACEDYDVIEIYLRCLNQTDYRKSDIFGRLDQMHKIISKSINQDGGYSYRITNSPLKRFVKNRIKNVTYSYSGWKLMETRVFESDIWASWFRALSVETIDYILNGDGINSYQLPGWGYIKKYDE